MLQHPSTHACSPIRRGVPTTVPPSPQLLPAVSWTECLEAHEQIALPGVSLYLRIETVRSENTNPASPIGSEAKSRASFP